MILCGYWIKVKHKPEPGQVVLAVQQVTGYKEGTRPRIVIASYIPARFEEYHGEEWEWCDIDENDTYWLPEGWYEQTLSSGDHNSMQITDEITHWMKLPGLPA